MLLAQKIIKRYGTLEVLRSVDIHIKRGEVVALVGPSGAGKSTLLHILGLIDMPDSGTLWLNQKNIQHRSSKKLNRIRNQDIGFIFQFHYLLPEFSALENVSLPMRIAGKSKKEAEDAAQKWLERLNLAHKAAHKPKELSGGEQQRVAVARALINEPLIILADEPSGNLDQKNAQALHDLFLRLNAELAQTFLIVTHNDRISKQCHRVLVMQDGQIINEQNG